MATRQLEAVALLPKLGDWTGRGAAYQHLARALRQAILDGRVPLATQLPGERDLALALGVSRTTVTAAYTALREAGFLLTRHGARGVTSLPAGTTAVGAPLPYSPASDGVLDLAYATLPAPEGAMHAAYAAALDALPAHLPTHGYAPLGLPALREAVAARYTARGLPTRAEEILITAGAQHAFNLILRALASPGDRVLVDQPTYPNALDALRHVACRPVPVQLTDAGWDLGAIRAALRQTAPRLAYLIPDFHNPTGHLMPETQRAELVRAAAEGRTVLVIDETMAELALDRPAPPPFAVHDPRGDTVTVGSLSKSCWGGLRIGWIRASSALSARIAAVRPSLDLGTPVLEQLAAVHLLAGSGSVLAVRRETLRRQRDRLTAQLGLHLPGWRYHPPSGGLSLWATLPSAVSSALAATSERHGVRVVAGGRFGEGGLLEQHLRVPFTLPESELDVAVSRLAQAYHALTSDGPPPTAEDAFTLV